MALRPTYFFIDENTCKYGDLLICLNYDKNSFLEKYTCVCIYLWLVYFTEVVCKFKPIKSKQVFLTLANNLEKVRY